MGYWNEWTWLGAASIDDGPSACYREHVRPMCVVIGTVVLAEPERNGRQLWSRYFGDPTFVCDFSPTFSVDSSAYCVLLFWESGMVELFVQVCTPFYVMCIIWLLRFRETNSYLLIELSVNNMFCLTLINQTQIEFTTIKNCNCNQVQKVCKMPVSM